MHKSRSLHAIYVLSGSCRRFDVLRPCIRLMSGYNGAHLFASKHLHAHTSMLQLIAVFCDFYLMIWRTSVKWTREDNVRTLCSWPRLLWAVHGHNFIKNKCITYLYPTISTLFTRILRFYVTEKLLDAFNDKPFVVVAQIKKKSENNKCIYNTLCYWKKDVFMLFFKRYIFM